MIELSRQAKINRRTARKALNGEVIAALKARQIAAAISSATGTTVNVGNIEGMVYR